MKIKFWVGGLVVFLFLMFIIGSAPTQGIFKKWIEDLNKVRVEANEKGAKSRVKMIVLASERYKSVNGHYSKSEEDLINAKPPYLPQSYNNREINEYKYSIDFNSDGYKIVATPVKCGEGGNKVFIAENSITKDTIQTTLSDEFVKEKISVRECE